MVAESWSTSGLPEPDLMRKTKEVVISSGTAPVDPVKPKSGENRDFGKKFLLTEMSADQAEKWAMRLTLAMTRAGMDVPEGATTWGAILAYGIMKGIGSVSWSDAEPLLDEMWACVQIVEPALVRKPTPDDVEEVSTRLLLRQEVFDLHAGFFTLGVILRQLAAEILMDRLSSNTPMSHPLSESSFPAEKPH